MVLPLLPLAGMLSAAAPFANISSLASLVPVAMPFASISKLLFSAIQSANMPSSTSMLFFPSQINKINNIPDPSEFLSGMVDSIAHMAVEATVGGAPDTTIGLGTNGTDGSVRLSLAQYTPEMPRHFSKGPEGFLDKVSKIVGNPTSSELVDGAVRLAFDVAVDAVGLGHIINLHRRRA